MSNPTKKAIIIGAGPAGLTAAYEFQKRTDIQPIVLEMSGDIGGISKTVNYKGNRIDIGGHRFFSKSTVVMDWWRSIMPLEGGLGKNEIEITYQNKKSKVKVEDTGIDPDKVDKVMLIRNRLSRIFYTRKFFSYPISINLETIMNLGFFRMIGIGFSYIWVKFFPIKEEKSLEDFFINRFGNNLYKTFFKDYTEKVWGVPCTEITAEWGAQRIKGLSITTAILHFLKSTFGKKSASIDQKDVETSLIEQFMYPKFGPGQLWEVVAKSVKEKGGEIHMHRKVVKVEYDGEEIKSVTAINSQTGKEEVYTGDYFFSTMPIKNLLRSMGDSVSKEVLEVSDGLVYRDFITVGLLLNEMKVKNTTKTKTKNDLVPDNWIYVQESDVKVGRIQVFNNWSPYMVKDDSKAWIGLEYFCNEGDELWSMDDDTFAKFAIDEMAKIDMIEKKNVLDSVVIRMPKTYPCYFGTYNRMDEIRAFVDPIDNLFLVGRNGMHRYNNQDHSMLTAIQSVDNIINNVKSKDNIWDINTEEEYHEEVSVEEKKKQEAVVESV